MAITRKPEDGPGDQRADSQSEEHEAVTRFQLRLPVSLRDEIKAQCKKRVGNFSMHNWLMEAIYEKLRRERGGE